MLSIKSGVCIDEIKFSVVILEIKILLMALQFLKRKQGWQKAEVESTETI